MRSFKVLKSFLHLVFVNSHELMLFRSFAHCLWLSPGSAIGYEYQYPFDPLGIHSILPQLQH